MRNAAIVVRHANRVSLEIFNHDTGFFLSAVEPTGIVGHESYDADVTFAQAARMRLNDAYDAIDALVARHNARVVDFIDASSE